MPISAQQVKELRQMTGAGMMECKRALQEADGDIQKAIRILKEKGLAAAAKRAHRAAKEGMVAISCDGKRAAMLELNCETDFVARTGMFREFAEKLVRQAMEDGVGDREKLLASAWREEPDYNVEQAISHLISKLGEKIALTRVVFWEAAEGNLIVAYSHMGGKIGVLVEGSEEAGEEALKDVAMQVAAMAPRFVSREDVTEDVLKEEREIAVKRAMSMGKPEHVAQKIAEGFMKKFYQEVVLLEQPFVKDQKLTVAKYLAKQGKGATVTRFARFVLGETSSE